MEYLNAVKHLLFIVIISLYSVESAPLTTSLLPSQPSTTSQPETQCQEIVSWKLKTLSPDSTLLPRCSQQGNYAALQRNKDKLQCVTPDLGWEIDVNHYSEFPCTALKNCVKENEPVGANDHKLIRCDDEGFFKLIQRTATGKICVNSYGIITKRTNVTRKSDCLFFMKEVDKNKDVNTTIQGGDNILN